MNSLLVKIKNKVLRIKKLELENVMEDLSIFENDKSIYIETTDLQSESNEFRSDYRKVLLTINSVKNGNQVPACRKMYTAFRNKYDLFSESNNKTKSIVDKEYLIGSICGHIEQVIQEKETLYRVI